MLFIYNFLIEITILFLRILSFFSIKIKFFLDEHTKSLKKLNEFKINPKNKRLLFHCASLGEFEQAKPLIQKIKSNYPGLKIIISFFSPSGYQIGKNYKFADFVCYLPFDSKKNVKLFLKSMKPSMVFLIKYEFWPNYIDQISRQNIPIISICTRLHKNQYIFKPYGKWLFNLIKKINHFFVQDETTKNLLEKNGVENTSLIGDTRMDRVIKTWESKNTFPKIEKFIGSRKCFIAGSTWKEDYEVILSKINSITKTKIIIAPHKVDSKSIKSLTSMLNKSYIFYSSMKEEIDFKKNILIIDSIGILSKIYKYGSLCYVGGGMGKDGLHNILEPSIFGLPIIIGKKYSKFLEAKDLINMGGVISVKNNEEFEKTFEKIINDSSLLSKIGKINKSYVLNNKGATDKIFSAIKQNLYL
ncbi:MAG: 3-deoxy-D-manno-octulosonic acid transferase [Flavobacteriaceae bacterium]|nr:3-deoxy-D-manno-octulosonic acid transferase [Flavobacteriaceae bacterium]|tara:strand:- start:27539 stop:28783 length:1245 start_codon:yes stop_codon:yes gene_type:complete